MKVIALPRVQEYLKELIPILYEKEYFGFEETAQKYVEELFLDIKTTLHARNKKPAPLYFNRYGVGMRYAIFPKNKNTQWYVFFNTYTDKEETIYLVRYISNNHIIAKYL